MRCLRWRKSLPSITSTPWCSAATPTSAANPASTSWRASLPSAKRWASSTCFFRRSIPGVSKEVAYQRLRRAGDVARKHGVIIVLETHRDLGANGDVHLETMRRVNHPNVRVNFDTGNITFYNRGTDAVTELKKIIDYVATVELKDHNGKYMDWNFPVLGKGVVDFPGILKVLEEHHFHGPITMEVEGHSWRDDGRSPDKTVYCRVGQIHPVSGQVPIAKF